MGQRRGIKEELPDALKVALAEACRLHERASSDAAQCQEFNRRMSRLLADLEDAGYDRTADQIMGVLLHCHPKDGSACDKAAMIADKMRRLAKNASLKDGASAPENECGNGTLL